MLRLGYLIVVVALLVSMITGVLGLYKHKNRLMREKFVTVSVILITVYSIYSLIFMFFAHNSVKVLLFFCGISPFVIGFIANYKKLNWFMGLQIMFILTSIVAVIL